MVVNGINLEMLSNEELCIMWQNETVDYRREIIASVLWSKVEKLAMKKCHEIEIFNNDFEDKMSLCRVAFTRCIKRFDSSRNVKFCSLFGIACDRRLFRESEQQSEGYRSGRKMINDNILDYDKSENGEANSLLQNSVDRIDDLLFVMNLKENLKKYPAKHQITVDLLNRGYTVKEISKIFGVSHQAVSQNIINKSFPKLYKEITGKELIKKNRRVKSTKDINLSTISDKRKDIAIEIYNGKSNKEIMDMFNVNKQYVNQFKKNTYPIIYNEIKEYIKKGEQ